MQTDGAKDGDIFFEDKRAKQNGKEREKKKIFSFLHFSMAKLHLTIRDLLGVIEGEFTNFLILILTLLRPRRD